MEKILRAWLCLTLLTVMGTICIAQDKPQVSTNPPPMAISLPVVKEVGKVKLFFDERNDKTIAQTSPLQVQGEWRNGIRLRGSFELPGKKLAAPSTVTLTLFSSANDRTYADNRALKVFLDDKQLLSETAQFERGNTNGEIFMISVKQDLPYDTFLKILNARKVRMQIGPAEFELKETDLEALRDLKRVIEQ